MLLDVFYHRCITQELRLITMKITIYYFILIIEIIIIMVYHELSKALVQHISVNI